MKPPLPASDAEAIGRSLVFAMKRLARDQAGILPIGWDSVMVDGKSVRVVQIAMDGGLADMMNVLGWAAKKAAEFDDRA
jgi:hypothetical protein